MLRYEIQNPIVTRSRIVRVEKRVRFTRVAGRYLREQAWQRVAAAANLDVIADQTRTGGRVVGFWKKLWGRAA